MIRAVIFDMDGLLIDSEPFWVESEIIVFNPVGIPLTKEMSIKTMGKRIDEVVAYWLERFPRDNVDKQQLAFLVIENVIRLVKEKGQVRNGVLEILKFFSGKKIPLAIASSSSMQIIEAVVDKLDIKKYFTILHSAQYEPFGKPHPGVFLSTASQLGIPPENCLVFEDSPNGVLAAKAAGMTCVAVPDKAMHTEGQFAKADMILGSLEEFTENRLKMIS